MAATPATSCGVMAGAGRGSMLPALRRRHRLITKPIVEPVMCRHGLPIGSMSADTRRSGDQASPLKLPSKEISKDEHVESDEHVQAAGRTSLHPDKRDPQRDHSLQPVRERRDYRGGT